MRLEDLQMVENCETCGGPGVVMSEYALQTAGDPTVDCPEGGWSDEPTCVCNTVRPVSESEFLALAVEHLKAKGATEVWWCEEHESGSIHDFGRCEWRLFADAEGSGKKMEPCRMTSPLLVPLSILEEK